MSKIMRMIVMFDLPVSSREERKIATQFRHFLLQDGYYMMQFSVYVRICNGLEAAEKHKMRLLEQLPKNGSVRCIVITERQFEAMEILCGERIEDLDNIRKNNEVLVL